MSKIHYFQRYSSVENTVTNNTLQLFARIYEYSATAASSVLSDVIGEPLEIGIEIQQQKPGLNSVPDGAIIQRSFKILIEAKVDAVPDVEQLVKHAGTFEQEAQKLLLLLTKQPLRKADIEGIRHRVHQVCPEIVFKNITYEEICSAIKDRFREHEATMSALVQDYIEYCNDTELFDQSKVLMRVVPCGESIKLNIKYGIYFQRSDRGYTSHAFVGIYAEKAVRAVWATESVFDIELRNDGRLLRTLVDGSDTDKYDQRIIDISKDAKRGCGYEIASGHRFFCGAAHETNYKKTSFGCIQGARFINLGEAIGKFTDASDVAAALRNVTWQ